MSLAPTPQQLPPIRRERSTRSPFPPSERNGELFRSRDDLNTTRDSANESTVEDVKPDILIVHTSWQDIMEQKSPPVIGAVVIVVAALLILGLAMQQWLLVEAHGEGLVEAGLYSLKTTLDPGYSNVDGVTYCETHNYDKQQCELVNNCCEWNVTAGCLSKIERRTCKVKIGESINICGTDSLLDTDGAYNSDFQDDLCSSIDMARWLVIVGIGLYALSALMMFCRLWIVVAKVLLCFGAVLVIISFYVFINNIYDELIEVIEVRYFSEFVPPRATYQYQTKYHDVGSSFMLVLGAMVFPLVFLSVIQLNYFLFKSPPPKPFNLKTAVHKVAKQKRNRIAPAP